MKKTGVMIIKSKKLSSWEWIYTEKNINYFKEVRNELINLIPSNQKKILEIGAGSGETLVKIIELGKAEEVVGVDLIKIKNSNQNNKLIDNFIIGNIENIELPYPKNYFDAIICGDVLEHLLDPWGTIKKLSNYLNKGGLIICSIPNFRKLSVIYSIIIGGDFKYNGSGILDKTHIRFFCKKNIMSLFKDNNFEIKELIPDYIVKKSKNKAGRIFKILMNYLTFKIFEDFFVTQFYVVAKK